MKKDYKRPEIEKAMLSVCDIITDSTAVDTPDGEKGVYKAVGDFNSWFGAN